MLVACKHSQASLSLGINSILTWTFERLKTNYLNLSLSLKAEAEMIKGQCRYMDPGEIPQKLEELQTPHPPGQTCKTLFWKIHSTYYQYEKANQFTPSSHSSEVLFY